MSTSLLEERNIENVNKKKKKKIRLETKSVHTLLLNLSPYMLWGEFKTTFNLVQIFGSNTKNNDNLRTTLYQLKYEIVIKAYYVF